MSTQSSAPSPHAPQPLSAPPNEEGYPEQLARLQAQLFALITQPEAVSEAAHKLVAQNPEILPVQGWICAAHEAEAVERVGIYADMFFARMLDALTEVYEVLKDALGEVRFQALCAAYLAAHPSQTPSIRFVGAALPEHIRSAGIPNTQRTDLADLAALEWARFDVGDREDRAVLSWAQIQGLASDRWAELRLKLIPAASLLQLQSEADLLWMALTQDTEIPAARECTRALIVWRQGWVVRHRVLSTEEHEALRLLERGATFGAVCEVACHAASAEVEAATLALHWLRGWLEDGLLAVPD